MLRSHRIPCSCVPAPVFLRRCYTLALPFARPRALFRISPLHYTFARPLTVRTTTCFPHAHARSHFHWALAVPRTHCALPLAVSCMRTPVRISAVRLLLPAQPLTAHARSLFPARPRPLTFPLHACCSVRSLRTPARSRPLAFPLRARCFPHACSLFPTRHFLLRLALPPPPRASSSASRFLLRLALPLRFASLGFAALGFASLAKPSQVPKAIKTGYRMSRVWIWSSKNGRQGGVGQPSQERYWNDEETNSFQEE
ncbi:hypothetical protein B0H13DRAFT_2357398 [Mycena leptocephala]|nr:hypothetical protein B0H13DRAFT_2357398 [Mycena leptocephala]